MTVMANNIIRYQKFEVKTPADELSKSARRGRLVETRMIDGVPCLVIPLTDEVEVNGIHVHLRDEEVLKIWSKEYGGTVRRSRKESVVRRV